MHVYCKYVCYLLSIYHSINVDTCISITLYAVCRYAIYIYGFSLLYVLSMYVHYLYTCICNSLSCVVVCLVLFGFTRYVCALICYCHWEKSSNLSFLGVDLMSLYQDLLQMITTNLYHDKLLWTWIETLFFLRGTNQSACRSWFVHFQNANYVKKSIWTRMTLRLTILCLLTLSLAVHACF